MKDNNESLRATEMKIRSELSNILSSMDTLRQEVAQFNKNKETYLNPETTKDVGSGISPTFQGSQVHSKMPGEKNYADLNKHLQNNTLYIASMRDSSKLKFAHIFGVLSDLDKKIQQVGDQLKKVPTHLEAMTREMTVLNITVIREDINSMVTVMSEIQNEIAGIRERQKHIIDTEAKQKDIIRLRENQDKTNAHLEQALLQNRDQSMEKNGIAQFRKQVNDEISNIVIVIGNLQNEIIQLRQDHKPNSNNNNSDARIDNQTQIASRLDPNDNNSAKSLPKKDLEYMTKEVKNILSQFEDTRDSSSIELKNLVAILKDFDLKLKIINTKFDKMTQKVSIAVSAGVHTNLGSHFLNYFV